MALLTCPDCSHRVSDLAASCPSCGRPRLEAMSATIKDSSDRAVRIEWHLSQIRVAVTFLAYVTAIGILMGVVIGFGV